MWPFKRAAPPVEVKANPVGAAFYVPHGAEWRRPSAWRAYVEEGYQLNVVVYRAVREIAQAISNLEIEVYSGGDVLDDHPALSLLARPNPLQAFDAFVEQVITDYLVFGEAAIVRPRGQKQPAELWPVSPAHVEVVPGMTGLPSAYRHNVNNRRTEFPVDPITGQADLFFFKSYNPVDYWRGQSPLMAAALAADTHNAGMRWNYGLLKNGARPSGILKTAGNLGRETIDRLREFFRARYQGEGNAGNIPILEGGLEWQAVDTNPRDMDYISAQKETAKLIASALGVPLPLVDNDASTFNNVEAAKERFYTDTVVPLANRFLGAFGAWLLPAYGEGLRFAVDMDAIPALEASRGRKFDRMMKAVQAGVLTIDEAREAIGYDTLGGAAAELDPIGQSFLAPGGPVDGDAVKALARLGYGG